MKKFPLSSIFSWLSYQEASKCPIKLSECLLHNQLLSHSQNLSNGISPVEYICCLHLNYKLALFTLLADGAERDQTKKEFSPERI